jgi:hypothetical protein
MKLKPDTAYFQARLHLARAKALAAEGKGTEAQDQIDAALSMLRRVESVLRVSTKETDAPA